MESNTLNYIILGACRAHEAEDAYNYSSKFRGFFVDRDLSTPRNAFPELYPEGSSYARYYFINKDLVFSRSDGALFRYNSDGDQKLYRADPLFLSSRIICAIADFFMYEIPLIIFTNKLIYDMFSNKGLDVKAFIEGIESADELDPEEVRREMRELNATTLDKVTFEKYANDYNSRIRKPLENAWVLGSIIGQDFISPCENLCHVATNMYGDSVYSEFTIEDVASDVTLALSAYWTILRELNSGGAFSRRVELALNFADIKATIEDRLLDVFKKCAAFRAEYDLRQAALLGLFNLMREVGIDPFEYASIWAPEGDTSQATTDAVLLRLNQFDAELMAYLPRFKSLGVAENFSAAVARHPRPEILIEAATDCILDCALILDQNENNI